MAVLVEGTSVIVRRDSIVARFKGGREAFEDILPTSPSCRDDDIVGVYFMDPRDADAFIEVLEMWGLVYLKDDNCVDMAVVDQKNGPIRPARWLQFIPDHFPTDGPGNKVSGCWFIRDTLHNMYGIRMPDGWEPGGRIMFYVPKGWSYETSISKVCRSIPREEVQDRLKFLRREGSVDVYLDRKTGKEVYTGRPVIEGQGDAAVHSRIEKVHHEIFAIEREMERLRSRGDEEGLARLSYHLGCELLPAVRQTAWNGSRQNMCFSYHTAGRILLLLGRRDEAQIAFRRAHDLQPEILNPLLELVRCLGEQDRHEEALPFARRAVDVEPESAAALGNLAACLLRCGQREEARLALDRAIELDPGDEINQNLNKYFERLLKKR